MNKSFLGAGRLLQLDKSKFGTMSRFASEVSLKQRSEGHLFS